MSEPTLIIQIGLVSGSASVTWNATGRQALETAIEQVLTEGKPGAADVLHWLAEMLDSTTSGRAERIQALLAAATREQAA